MYWNKNSFAHDATGVEVMCTPIEMQAGEDRHGMNQKAWEKSASKWNEIKWRT